MIDISPVGCPFIPGWRQGTFPNSQLATQFPTSSRNLLHGVTLVPCVVNCVIMSKISKNQLATQFTTQSHGGHSFCQLRRNLWKVMKTPKVSSLRVLLHNVTLVTHVVNLRRNLWKVKKSPKVSSLRNLLHTVTLVTYVVNCVQVLQKVEKTQKSQLAALFISIGWIWLVGSLKIQVSFAEYRSLL